MALLLTTSALSGEGNGNPLQCSCLENPRDRGAQWAAVYGVAESDTTEATWQQQPCSLMVFQSLFFPTSLFLNWLNVIVTQCCLRRAHECYIPRFLRFKSLLLLYLTTILCGYNILECTFFLLDHREPCLLSLNASVEKAEANFILTPRNGLLFLTECLKCSYLTSRDIF